jgi:hypothetical protein
MPKSKKPADAFGLSLLDVLSNALGGVILLMLIVASAIASGERKKQIESPVSSGGGKVLSDQDFEKKKQEEDTVKVFTTQLMIIGIAHDSVEADLLGGNAYLSEITDTAMRKNNAYYLISGEGDDSKDLNIELSLKLRSCKTPLSIQAFSTMGNTPKETSNYKNISLLCGEVNTIILDYSGSERVTIAQK